MDLNLDYENLSQWLIFANIPQYLYSHFREDLTVQVLARNNSLEQLITIYNERESKLDSIPSIKSLVEIYSILIAVSFKTSSEIILFYEKISLTNNIKWIEKIANYSLELNYQTNFGSFEFINPDKKTNEIKKEFVIVPCVPILNG